MVRNATRSPTAEQGRRVRRLPAFPRLRRLALLGGICLVLLLLVTSAHVRIGLKSAGFMIEIFPDMPAYPSRWFSAEPQRLLVTFPHDDGSEGAFLYLPASDNCHAGMVFYIGLGPEHRDEHLDRAARAFARNGIAVLVPVSQSMVDYSLEVEDHAVAVSAFKYLQAQKFVDPERIGMFGVSVGGSIVANAAQVESINQDVAMVHSLGGYFDAFDVLAGVALGAAEVDGEWVDWEPSDATIRATRGSILALMPDDDYALLWPLFDDDVDEIPDGLTAAGEALARLLVNRDPERVPELVAQLPAELTAYLRQISPSHGIENLLAETLILHDVHDHVLHYSESRRFYQHLDTGEDNRLTLIEQFHHVRPDEDGDLRAMFSDGMRLYRHIYHLHRTLDDRGWFVNLSDILPWTGDASSCP